MNPFEVARLTGNNLATAFGKVRDENAIDRILSEASNDPQKLQGAIGQILSQVSPERQGPAIQYLQNSLQNFQQNQVQQRQNELQQRQRSAIEQEGINPDLPSNLQTAAFTARNRPAPKATQASQPIAPEQLALIEKVRQDPNYDPSNPLKIYQSMTTAGVSKENAKAEADLAAEAQKNVNQLAAESRKETLDLRKEYVQRGEAARKGIENKNRLMELIDRGNINDPTYAIVADLLPANLGKRMLSDDTVTYKAGLVDEFTDLRNIFQGQTRVKEIEILENKLADIYLDDNQKKAILKSRLGALNADIIKEEVAQEVERDYPNLSILQFSKKVNELSKPRLENLFNNILEQQKNIFAEAELRKKLPLKIQDPQDYKIMTSILEEAGGDRNKAKKIAKQKGYSW